MRGAPIAGRRSWIYRLWLFAPASALIAVWFAFYERSPAAVPSAQFYILCGTPKSLTALSLGAVLCIFAAAAVSVAGAVRAVRTPSRGLVPPVFHLAVALMLVVAADGLDYFGGGIAYRSAVHNGPDVAGCESAYHVTPGWLFFLPAEDRSQWPSHAVEPR